MAKQDIGAKPSTKQSAVASKSTKPADSTAASSVQNIDPLSAKHPVLKIYTFGSCCGTLLTLHCMNYWFDWGGH